MPKKNKTSEDHLQIIEYLLAGLLLKKEPDIKKVAKILGCSDVTLTKLYPEHRKHNKKQTKHAESDQLDTQS
jgi:transcription initiation factor TFIIIB Brf1 subunit/transcription initiation factor TFIIB